MFPQGAAPQGAPQPQIGGEKPEANPIMQAISLSKQLEQLGVPANILSERFKAVGSAADAAHKVKRAMTPSKDEKKAQAIPPSLKPPPPPPPQMTQRPPMGRPMAGPTGMPPSLAAMLQGLR